MPITTTLNRVSYAGDGVTTVFPYPFPILANTDLEVVRTNIATGVESVRTLTTHYTVSGAGGASGSVTMLTPPASGERLTIRRVMPRTQLVDYVENDSFPAATHERVVDKLTMIVQELDKNDTRTLRQPTGDDADIAVLPSKVDRASKYLSFNANGDPVAAELPVTGTSVSSYMATMLDDANAGEARSTLGLGDMALETTEVRGFTTGDVKLTLKTTADSGWVLMNDTTIGNAVSGATGRANADTEALFTLLWNNVDNAHCAVSGGRGASAAADFAANKTIALPKVLGRALAVAGSGLSLSPRNLASALGSENAVVVEHNHGVTDPGHTHTYNYRTGTDIYAGGGSSGVWFGTLSQNTGSNTTGVSVNNAGVSGSQANMQPTVFLNVMIKL